MARGTSTAQTAATAVVAGLPVVGIPEEDQILTILEWIGFPNGMNRANICDESFKEYNDMMNLTNKDINVLVQGFSSRGTRPIVFGMRRTKKLKNVVNWVQDFERTSERPSIEDHDKASFAKAIMLAGERALVRKVMIEQSDQKSKAASPGPLKNEAMWLE